MTSYLKVQRNVSKCVLRNQTEILSCVMIYYMYLFFLWCALLSLLCNFCQVFKYNWSSELTYKSHRCSLWHNEISNQIFLHCNRKCVEHDFPLHYQLNEKQYAITWSGFTKICTGNENRFNTSFLCKYDCQKLYCCYISFDLQKQLILQSIAFAVASHTYNKIDF